MLLYLDETITDFGVLEYLIITWKETTATERWLLFLWQTLYYIYINLTRKCLVISWEVRERKEIFSAEMFQL